MTLSQQASEAVKRCCRCAAVKPVSEYSRRTVAKDGLNPLCRACDSDASRRNRLLTEDEKLARQLSREKRHLRKINSKQKTCSKCRETKPKSEFGPHERMDDGLHIHCRECRRRSASDYRERNLEKVREREKERSRRLRQEDPERERLRIRNWIDQNREKWTATARITARNRYRTDPAYKTQRLFRRRFLHWFGARGAKRKTSISEAIGCDWSFLCSHLESQFKEGMSWDNHGFRGWHIDHIIPLASAGNDETQMLKLWHYKNLQPLWAEENLRKGAKHARADQK